MKIFNIKTKTLNQRGDMLVEVTMALAVLAAVLLTALNVANKAFGVSNSAKERSVASGLLQEQAERLRNYRDSHVWGGATGTYATIQGVGFSPTKFHMDPAAPGANCLTSGIYNVCVVATDKSTPAPAKNKLLFDITVNWSGVGGGQNRSMLSTVLVDLDGLAPLLPLAVTPGPGPVPPGVPAVTLAVSQSNVAPNTSITLTWTTANVTTCSATAGPWTGSKNANGASEVRPASDTATPGTVTYTISCNNGGAPVTDSETVTVTALPPPPPTGIRLEAENMTPGSTCVPYKVTNGAAGPTPTNNAGRLDCYLDSASISNFNIGPSWSKLIVRARIGSSNSCGGPPILSITIGLGAYNVSVTTSSMSNTVYPPFPMGSFPGGVANITISASNAGSSDFYHGAGDNCEIVVDYLEFQI